MKTIGLIGSARSLVYTVDFAGVEQMQREGRWDAAAAVAWALGEATP